MRPQALAVGPTPATPGSPAVARLRRLPPLSSRVIHFNDPQRDERRRVEAFIEATYARTYGGTITCHYPILMSVQDDSGRIYAAVGFRLARDGGLFLEQYLDAPVERAIATARGLDGVARGRVAEIGNLASDGRGATVFLFLELARHLRQIGCDHAVVTATNELRGIFAKAGFPTVELAPAKAERLADGGASWGAYYHKDPVVLAGSIAETLRPLTAFAEASTPEAAVHSRLHYGDRRTS